MLLNDQASFFLSSASERTEFLTTPPPPHSIPPFPLVLTLETDSHPTTIQRAKTATTEYPPTARSGCCGARVDDNLTSNLGAAALLHARMDHVESVENSAGREAVEEFWEKAVESKCEGLMIKVRGMLPLHPSFGQNASN
jgi:hypothetical protein